ncbi:RhoGAP domain containing protein [Acanthamoeba castellanii str. Neff]|uniref:RhoGAP domain containing protein n=1 Tax=Acanthamoeba castellanii (strain ATCC 30010 / Neff) TaxID=1257118 RepID=L8HBF5_ACACF|nr:RhoGAP domain containing protein [Acanthamoeba castellanii str. Neff]ELR22562.1 RhoGAP domain containing protein [Acanthamoeba castellanii str. Neff]
MGGKSSRQARSATFSDEAFAQSRLTNAKKETPTDLNLGKKKDVVLSKEVIDFNLGEEPCPLNEIVRDQFTITNESGKKIKFRFDPIPSASCKLSFEPASGTIDGGKKNVKKIGVKMVLLMPESLNFRGVYGADPMALEIAEDCGFEVPVVLKSMREALVDQDALSQEGIFRLAGDQNEMKRIKGDMNRTKTFDAKDADMNTIANLLKVWFRELPVPILNALPTEVIFHSGDPNVCIDAYEGLQEPQKSLLGWLLHLMADVAALKAHNKMSEQNLGSDPMEGLVMSQKAVQFLHNLILNEIELRHAEQRGDE